MTQTRTYPAGVPCWVDTAQPDIEAARTFYGELFGWTFEAVQRADAPGAYVIATLDGEDVAAIASSDGPPATWNTYVAVADARSVAARVWDAGGRVVTEPFEVGPAGWMAVCEDPGGAVFRLWQSGARPGAQAVNVPGSWNFSDLRTADTERAERFYAHVFGWEPAAIMGPDGPVLLRMPGYGDHLAATVDPGIHARQQAVNAPDGFADAIGWVGPLGDQPSARWHTSFAVADRDASAARAAELGADVLKREDAAWTRTATIRDPQGAVFTLSQFTPPGS